jgi:hypothetical protein
VPVGNRPLKGAWGITALIFLFMLINFADKIVVGLAAKPIMAEPYDAGRGRAVANWHFRGSPSAAEAGRQRRDRAGARTEESGLVLAVGVGRRRFRD